MKNLKFKLWYRALFWLLCLLIFVQSSHAQDEGIGHTVVAIEGSAQLQRSYWLADRWEVLLVGDSVRNNDLISVSEGGTVTIACDDGSISLITRFSSPTCNDFRGTNPILSGDRGSDTRGIVLRLELLYPNGLVTKARPDIVWLRVENASRYEVTIKHDLDSLGTFSATEPFLAFPLTTDLSAGSYRIEIIPLASDGSRVLPADAVTAYNFSVADAQELEAVNTLVNQHMSTQLNPFMTNYIFARIYASLGFYAEAVQFAELAFADSVNRPAIVSPDMYINLGSWYDQLGVISRAETAYRQAELLAQGNHKDESLAFVRYLLVAYLGDAIQRYCSLVSSYDYFQAVNTEQRFDTLLQNISNTMKSVVDGLGYTPTCL